MRAIVSLFLFVGLAYAKHESYEGYSLYQVSVENADQVAIIQNLETSLGVDIWSHAVPGRPGQVLVAKDKKIFFETGLKVLGVDYLVQTENIKQSLDAEDKLLAEASKKPFNASRVDSLTFDRILEYDEVDAFLEALAAAYPEKVTLVNAGKSFEGRDIKYLKISTTNFENSSKPIVFIQSLLHAREWVTLPATLYAIKKLVIDVVEQDLLQDIDWIILPVVNPDGYIFSHAENRFWRKNRATGYMIQDLCVGVDLNRNFDGLWSTDSSNLVCSDTFHGRGPFSEPETAIIRDIFDEHKDRIELYMDIHSFGSMILYGFGNGQLPSNGLILHLVGVQMAQAIDAVKLSFNPNYIVGNSALVLYNASGTASDYASHIGVPLGYTYELPGHRRGFGTALGFLVDPDFIEQAGFETWEGIKAGARLLDLEDQLLAKTSKKPFDARVDSLTFDRILTYEEVNSFLEALAEDYPETVTLVNGGNSFEGRDIYYLKISSSNFEDESKPIIFFETLLHAREWITLPVSLYAIKKLVIDVTEQDLVEDIDWIILPIANPDGFSFTHERTRLWRKNRATGYTPLDTCIGVDLNRNFDVAWSTASSSNPCSDTFHGRAPFSEPETALVRDIFAEYNDRIEIFLDIHSFGSMILYGYGTGVLPPNGLILHLAGVLMAQAIDAVKESFNINYIVGNSALTLYFTSGSAQDYGQIQGGLSYTFELPRYNGSGSGFLVNPDFIEQAGYETWEGIKAGARFVQNRYRERISFN